VTSRRGSITFCFYPSADPPPRPRIPFPHLKNSAVQTNAKYGDESVYFDLGDVESTTGSWDVYGVESKARYPDQQEKFFEQAAQGLGRREAMYSFLALAGPAACLVFGAKGSKDAKLPITVGPQKEPQLGPRDRL
jgi:photosystem I subunit 6